MAVGTGSLHANVIFDFYDSRLEEHKIEHVAKGLLRVLSHSQELLPGAAIKGGEGGGVENILQRPSAFLDDNYEGHIVWMSEFNEMEAFVTLGIIAAASVAAWIFDTGAFHFLLALVVVARIDYEAMALHGLMSLLAFMQHAGDGVQVFHDSWGVTLVTLSLGLVEFVNEFVKDEDEQTTRPELQIVIILSAALSFACMLPPLLLWKLYYKRTDGSSYQEVMARDGSMECLLTGEKGTGYRCGDSYPNNVGVGLLKAQQCGAAWYWNGLGTSYVPSNPHCDRWVLCGSSRSRLTPAEAQLFVGSYLGEDFGFI